MTGFKSLKGRLQIITDYYGILPNITEHYRTLPNITKHYQILPNITKYYQKLPNIISFVIRDKHIQTNTIQFSLTRFINMLSNSTAR